MSAVEYRVFAPPRAVGVSRRQAAALTIYLALFIAPLAATAAMTFDLLDAEAARGEAQSRLARLERRPVSGTQGSGEAKTEASPFLSGNTITVAGAALQQRLQDATAAAGGKVISSQIDLQAPRAAEGYVGLTQNLEIDESALQSLLYEIESGAPYLFLESVAAQSPRATGEVENSRDGSRMRVVIQATGQWRDSR